MTPATITQVLQDLFGAAVQASAPEAWQIELENSRLLILLSEDQSWLRAMVSILPQQEAQPFLVQLLEDNFDATQEVRYALHQGILWGMFQHSCQSLNDEDFKSAIAQLLTLKKVGLDNCFSRLVDTQIRQIVAIAKQQGQRLETTLQNLDRLYEEGVMGNLNQGAQSRQAVLAAWKYQLERLWNEVD
jgi:hypothetical protein